MPELHEEFGDWLALRACMPSRTRCCTWWSPASFAAWVLYIKWPHLPGVIDAKLKPLRCVLENKYCFDWFNENVLAAGGRLLGKIFWKAGDQAVIDGVAGQWLGQHHRLHRRRRAPGAERLPLFLRLLDGHRPGRDARLVPDAHLS